MANNSSRTDEVISSGVAPRRSSSRSKRADIGTNLIGALGGKDEVTQKVKKYVVSNVESKLQGVDINDSFDKVIDVAGKSARAMRAYARKNPRMFWAGVASIALGAGLIAGAARTIDDEATVEFDIDPDVAL